MSEWDNGNEKSALSFPPTQIIARTPISKGAVTSGLEKGRETVTVKKTNQATTHNDNEGEKRGAKKKE